MSLRAWRRGCPKDGDPGAGGTGGRRRRVVSALVAGALVLAPLPGLTASASASAAAAGGTTAPVGTAAGLTAAWAEARHVPTAAVAGIRPGTLHVAGAVRGADWALATLEPSPHAPVQARNSFQDGAATGLFTRRGRGPWHVVALGPEQGTCHEAVPAVLRRRWGLAAGSCPSPAHMDAAAARARAALPSKGGFGPAIARVALGQVGVSDTPTSDNFGLDCDPYSTMVGPAFPNAIGCGVDARFHVVNENETWCSDFAKWVWQQAGVTAGMDRINAGSVSYYGWGRSRGERLTVDSTHPQVGDAVVFFPPGPVSASDYADHVGIVTAVNADGTVDLVNGDFAGATTIGVQYDQHVDLSTWASQVWNPGEQWVFVAPPSGTQAPTPLAAVTGPHQAVTGAPVSFRSHAVQPGGTVASDLWTFGDGGTASSANATHVFGEPGPHTVTFTATSAAHTVTTRTWTVDVAGSSSPATADPSNAVWYSATPVTQHVFRRGADGALMEERSNGGGWTATDLPVTLAAGTRPTALELPSTDDRLQPVVLADTASGTVVAASPSGAGWSTVTLPGAPAAGSSVTALAVPTPTPGPAVVPQPDTVEAFFVGSNGHVVEATRQGGSWQDTTLPGPRAGAPTLAAAVSAGATVTQAVYYVDGAGRLLVADNDGHGGWHTRPVPAARPAPSTPLAALAAPGGGTAVVLVGRGGHLQEVGGEPGGGRRAIQPIPGVAPAAAAGLAATDALLPSGAVSQEVAWVGATGQPQLSARTAGGWATASLPGPATAVDGLDAYPEYVAPGEVKVPGPSQGAEQQLYLEQAAHGTRPAVDATARGSAGFAQTALPASATTVAGSVVLYGATPAALQMAQQAASQAGLAPTQVTGSFATAWDDAVDGHHLVVTVGQSSTDALYFNGCGWPTPSGTITDSTPFGYVVGPTAALPGADVFEDGTAAQASQDQQRADDLAAFAAGGSLPAGVTSVPAAGPAQSGCSGSPVVGAA